MVGPADSDIRQTSRPAVKDGCDLQLTGAEKYGQK